MNQLQALVTGMLAGTVSNVDDFVAIDVQIPTDGEGNYLPEFFVTGKNSGTKLRVVVEVVEEGERE